MSNEKKEWIIVVLVSLVLFGIWSVWRQYQAKRGRENLEQAMNTRMTKATVARDGYTIYVSRRNKERGTEGVHYFPCPTSYVCDQLPPPRFNRAQRLEFDPCTGPKCIEALHDVLYLYGVEDFDDYLSDKKK